MEIQGILFDKDGTLLEFDRTWRPVVNRIIGEILLEYQLPETIRNTLGEAIGLYPDRIDPQGSLSCGTNRDVAEDLLKILGNQVSKEDFVTWSTKAFDRMAAELPVYPVAGALELMENLRKEGIRIGLSTADSVENATFFLQKTGLYPYFDFIGADDGVVNPKPAVDYMLNFCSRYGFSPKNVAVVGDTLTDMTLGKNSGTGLRIGVLSGTGTRELLAPHADLVTDGIGNLWTGDGFLWEVL